MNGKQFNYSHSREMDLSFARLDYFYCFKHHLNMFKRCFINPAGFRDYCFVRILLQTFQLGVPIDILPLLF